MKSNSGVLLLSLSLSLSGWTSAFAAEDAARATAVVKLENVEDVQGAEVRDFISQVTGRPALDEIAARLALKAAWKLDPEQTAKKLAGVLEVEVDRRGDGRISATDESPVMAAILANTAASILKDRRGKPVSVAALTELRKAVSDQQAVVEQRRVALAEIIRREGIVIPQGQEQAPPPGPQDALRAQEFVDAKSDFEASKNLQQQLEAKTREEEDARMIRVHHINWATAPEK